MLPFISYDYKKWIVEIHKCEVDKQLVNLNLIATEYSVSPLFTYGDVLSFEELEFEISMLIDDDFSRLTEVIYIDPFSFDISVHPEIAISYLDSLEYNRMYNEFMEMEKKVITVSDLAA